jgi:hypothetical protein
VKIAWAAARLDASFFSSVHTLLDVLPDRPYRGQSRDTDSKENLLRFDARREPIGLPLVARFENTTTTSSGGFYRLVLH